MKKTGRPGEDAVGGNSDIAVALNYDGNNAPRVTAKGSGEIAERIIAAAREADVPLYPNADLAVVLSQIPLGEEIPETLYRAVAEVISFAYIVSGRFPEGFMPPGPDEKT